MAGKYVDLKIDEHPEAVVDLMRQLKHIMKKAQRRHQIGCAIIAILFIGAAFTLMVTELFSVPIIIVASVGIIIGFSLSAAGRVYFPENQFDAAYTVFRVLRDDTGCKGRITGRLDLSGATQSSKKTRQARSGGGKMKVYYRDTWLQTKFKLADGNILRISLRDKIKTKSGAEVRRRTQIVAKLSVNPNLYRINEVPAGGWPLKQASVYQNDNTINVKAEVLSNPILIKETLGTIKKMYVQNLIPITQSETSHDEYENLYVPVSTEMGISQCPGCGASIVPGQQQCIYCGQKFT